MKQKFFNPYLKNSIFFTQEKLKKVHLEILKDHPIVKKSNIYFVTKIKKMRFDTNSLKIGYNYNLKGKIKYGSKIKNFDLSIPNFLFDSLPLEYQTYYTSPSIFVKTFYSMDKRTLVPQFLRFKREHSINNELSNIDGKDITINSGLVKRSSQNNEYDHINLFATNLIGLKEPFEINGDLIYIGRSKDVIKRLSTHEKKTKFDIELNDDEELLYYFFEFENNKIEKEVFPELNNFTFIYRDEVNEIKDENVIEVIEAALINYFKPIINIQEKKIDLIKSEKVKKYLKANGYTDIAIEIDSAGEFMKFGNKLTSHKNRHSIEYTI